jgi:hypothetical protein
MTGNLGRSLKARQKIGECPHLQTNAQMLQEGYAKNRELGD